MKVIRKSLLSMQPFDQIRRIRIIEVLHHN